MTRLNIGSNNSLLVAAFCLILLLTACNQGADLPTAAQQSPDPSAVPTTVPAVVTRVVDGDTLYVTFEQGKEEKVRLTGIDTPESTSQVEPYGRAASAYTRQNLTGRQVFLEMDAGERDKYGRLLAYIWLEVPVSGNEAEAQAKMFNAHLLLQGYAQVMTVPPNVKYSEIFGQFESKARQAKSGLWASSQ